MSFLSYHLAVYEQYLSALSTELSVICKLHFMLCNMYKRAYTHQDVVDGPT